MKILALGDFHGKFPGKLKRKLGKEKFDLIVSPGDYCGNEELARLFFKYVYGTESELWEFIGRRKNNILEKRNLESGKKILKELDKSDKKIIGITGNWDPANWHEVGFSGQRDKYAGKFKRSWRKLKNVKIIDFDNYNLFGYNFVGYPRSTYPGKADKYITKKYKKRFGKEARGIFNKINKDNKNFYRRLKEKFKENTIFISHNCPYKSKLDKIKKGIQKGEHYGSWLAKKIILDLKPVIVICGHMHENQGKCKIGKSLVINPGAASDGKAAIIELDDTKKRVIKVKFLR